jgi:hypothetical protein
MCFVARKMEKEMTYSTEIIESNEFRGDPTVYAEKAAIKQSADW